MKLTYSISHTFIQSGLTAVLLITWQIYILEDIFKALQSQIILIFFIGIFGFGFGILFHGLPTVPRILATSILTALMVTLVLTQYPQFGYDFEWHILLSILLLAGLLAHVLLYGSGANYGEKKYDST